jgi:hypothetical protein
MPEPCQIRLAFALYGLRRRALARLCWPTTWTVPPSIPASASRGTISRLVSAGQLSAANVQARFTAGQSRNGCCRTSLDLMILGRLPEAMAGAGFQRPVIPGGPAVVPGGRGSTGPWLSFLP